MLASYTLEAMNEASVVPERLLHADSYLQQSVHRLGHYCLSSLDALLLVQNGSEAAMRVETQRTRLLQSSTTVSNQANPPGRTVTAQCPHTNLHDQRTPYDRSKSFISSDAPAVLACPLKHYRESKRLSMEKQSFWLR